MLTFRSCYRPGSAEKTYHHSRFREQSWARKVFSPDPTIRIHPETAAQMGLVDGAWIVVETGDRTGALPASCKEITDRTAPNVVTTGIGWWRPERLGPRICRARYQHQRSANICRSDGPDERFG